MEIKFIEIAANGDRRITVEENGQEIVYGQPMNNSSWFFMDGDRCIASVGSKIRNPLIAFVNKLESSGAIHEK